MASDEVVADGDLDVTEQQLGLLTVPEVAKLLRRGQRTTWQRVWDGEIASMKIGQGRRVTRQAVAAYQKRIENDETIRRSAASSGSAA